MELLKEAQNVIESTMERVSHLADDFVETFIHHFDEAKSVNCYVVFPKSLDILFLLSPPRRKGSFGGSNKYNHLYGWQGSCLGDLTSVIVSMGDKDAPLGDPTNIIVSIGGKHPPLGDPTNAIASMGGKDPPLGGIQQI
ncbi:unnamed protein product [Vicia faba]|uniref:Uncharacterized protein n=1 Tax=Vicia faba TaxID=3906 RepID=A0AAV1B0C7_VICFA|nr:unnamed protein product [Vicia faba]